MDLKQIYEKNVRDLEQQLNDARIQIHHLSKVKIAASEFIDLSDEVNNSIIPSRELVVKHELAENKLKQLLSK